MNDPKRWLDEGGGATFEERELLDAGRRAALPNALRKRIWLGVATGAASLGAVSEAAGALGVSAVSKGLLASVAGSAAAKTVLVVALMTGVGFGVTTVRSPHHAAPVIVTAPRSIAAPPPPAIPASPGGEIALLPVRAAPAPVRSPAAKSLPSARSGDARVASAAASPSEDDARGREAPLESRMASRLREESVAVLAIRKKLLAGEFVEALRMLERARAAFPGGALAEEREALAVRALVASGQKELARRRGEAFLQAFPRSPHASEVRTVLGP